MDLEDAWKLYYAVHTESSWADMPIDCLCTIAETTVGEWETAFLFTQVCKSWKDGIAGADTFWRKRFAVDYGISVSRDDCNAHELYLESKRVKIRGRCSSFDSGDKTLKSRRVKQIFVQERGGMVLDMFGEVWVWGTSYLFGAHKGSFTRPSRVKIYGSDNSKVRAARIGMTHFNSYVLDFNGRIWTWGHGHPKPCVLPVDFDQPGLARRHRFSEFKSMTAKEVQFIHDNCTGELDLCWTHSVHKTKECRKIEGKDPLRVYNNYAIDSAGALWVWPHMLYEYSWGGSSSFSGACPCGKAHFKPVKVVDFVCNVIENTPFIIYF
jgi:hypothetical protein